MGVKFEVGGMVAFISNDFCEQYYVLSPDRFFLLKSALKEAAIFRRSFRSGPGRSERANCSIWRRK